VLQPTFKIFSQRERGRVPALRIFVETLEADRCKVAIYFPIPEARLPRLGVQNQSDSFISGTASKRWMASEQLVKHCAESVDIRGATDARVISHRLFRRHVAGRAQNFHCARDATLCFDQPCQSEIGEMRFAFCVQQNVSGFDIAMQDAVLMRIVHRPRQFGDQFSCVTDRHRFALRDGIELAALHQTHAEVTGAVALSDFVNRDDIRMI
jgi:hypothetical protein